MNNHHTPFKVTIRTMAPVIMSASRLTLDGLLSAAVYAETGLKAEETYEHIPLARTDGVFHGSSLFAEGAYRNDKVTRVGVITRYHDMRNEAFLALDKHNLTQKALEASLGNKLNDFEAYQADQFVFFGLGDAGEVERLFSLYVHSLGRGYNRGYGAIDSVEVEDIESDHSIQLEDGSPARPIPFDIWKNSFNGRTDQVMLLPHTWRAPYWQTEATLCVVPEAFSLETQRTLAKLAA